MPATATLEQSNTSSEVNPFNHVRIGDNAITLSAIAKLLPKRKLKNKWKRIHTTTLWRWCMEGQYGVTMAHVFTGGTIYSSLEAAQFYLEQVAQRRRNLYVLRKKEEQKQSIKKRVERANTTSRANGISRSKARKKK